VKLVDPDGNATEGERKIAGAVVAAHVKAGTEYASVRGDSGLDCSQLVMQAYPGIGNWTGEQYQNTSHVPLNEKKNGDVAFMTTDASRPNGHVGVVGNVKRDSEGNVTDFSVTHMSGGKKQAVTDTMSVGKDGKLGGRLRNVFREARTYQPETDPERMTPENIQAIKTAIEKPSFD
jgi:hypothetical protein